MMSTALELRIEAVDPGQQEAAQLKREVERKRAAIERQINGLRSEYESEALELRRIAEQVGMQTRLLTTERAASGILRQADVAVTSRSRVASIRAGKRSGK